MILLSQAFGGAPGSASTNGVGRSEAAANPLLVPGKQAPDRAWVPFEKMAMQMGRHDVVAELRK